MHRYKLNIYAKPRNLTWNGKEQDWSSHILNGFVTNFSRIPTSQSVISPLLEPTGK